MSEIANVSYLAVEGRATTAEEAIRLCGAELVEAGCVRDGFAQNCINRERDYPTGICSEVPVALPHSTSDDIVKSALCYLRLAEPVEFKRMDDDQKSVETRHVFNLAVDRGDHLTFLSRVVRMLQDGEKVASLETMDINEAAAFLKAAIEEEG